MLSAVIASNPLSIGNQLLAPRVAGAAPLGARAAGSLRGIGDAFGPAVMIGRATPPSVFVIYNARGILTPIVARPNPTVTPPTLDASHANLPATLLYNRLGNSVQQIQLNLRNGRLTNQFTIGAQLIV